MSYALRMLETFPGTAVADRDALAACIDACFDCAQTCTACADACLAEDGDLSSCIRLNLDCAAQTLATGQAVTRQMAANPQLLQTSLAACVDACTRCAEECEGHARHGMTHCAVCAEACRTCEQACNTLIAALFA